MITVPWPFFPSFHFGICLTFAPIHPQNSSRQDIYHERAWLESRIDQVVVQCVVETTGIDHCNRLFAHLEAQGYPVTRQ